MDEPKEKQPKTPEELAEIACLDKLRSCEGEAMPVGLPLVCIVKVVAYGEIPKASEQYAMATVEGWGGQTWRVCVRRYYLEEGMLAMFVSHEALLPEDDERFDNLDVCKLHEPYFARNHDLYPLIDESIANRVDKNQMAIMVRLGKNTTQIVADIVKNSRPERSWYGNHRL